MLFGYWLFIACVCFLAFTIGLNLGLHGLLSLAGNISSTPNSTGNDSQDKIHDASSVPQTATKLTTSNIINNHMTSSATDTMNSAIIVANPLVKNLLGESIEAFMQNVLHSETYQSLLLSKYKQYQTKVSSHMSSSLLESSSIPILLMTCNRPELLQITIDSLFSVRGVSKSNILASQDGANVEVKSILNRNQLTFVQNLEGINLRGGISLDGAQRIARHYKYSIDKVFDHYPQATAVIIVEDDLLFSPDFYEYFMHALPALEVDPTLFLISAWNDNGFKGKVKDVHALQRTEFFPGLGWLLPRMIYDRELRHTWPTEHWDHWLRSYQVHKGREIVYPQVPRSYHNGIKGTFMNLDTHNRYFRDIAYNVDGSVSWSDSSAVDVPSAIHVDADVYEERILTMIKSCQHVSSLQKLQSSKNIVCIWIHSNPNPDYHDFHPIAEFFNIWHEHQRGSHRGLHEFYWEGRYILLLNTFPIANLQSYQHVMPSTTTIFLNHEFDKKLYDRLQMNNIPYEVYASSVAGVSCDRICRDNNKKCQQGLLPLVNNCDELKKRFPCHDCTSSYGFDQPAYVNPAASKDKFPGMCLVNSQPDSSDCHSSHELTMRLCPCVR